MGGPGADQGWEGQAGIGGGLWRVPGGLGSKTGRGAAVQGCVGEHMQREAIPARAASPLRLQGGIHSSHHLAWRQYKAKGGLSSAQSAHAGTQGAETLKPSRLAPAPGCARAESCVGMIRTVAV